MKYLGIRFPFTCKDSEGFLFDLTTTESDEIKSVIKLILTTPKNQRYRNPNVSSSLLEYLFEPNDDVNMNIIKDDIQNTLSLYLKGLTINDIQINNSSDNLYSINIRIDYKITDGFFTQTDFVIINI